MNIAENLVIADPKAVVAVFALEMTKVELAQRMICSVGQVNMDDALKGKLADKEEESLKNLWKAQALMGSMNIFVDESSIQTPQSVLNKCRRLKARMGRLDLVIVDHMQLMDSASQNKNESRQQQITDISRGLKMAAKELDVPLIALSQLSRQVTSRNGGKAKPILSDLRESGAIEQDADVVVFLHRPVEETSDGDAAKRKTGPELIEVYVEKNRNGMTGSFNLLFKGQYVKFVNYSELDAPTYYSKKEKVEESESDLERVPFTPDDADAPPENEGDDYNYEP